MPRSSNLDLAEREFEILSEDYKIKIVNYEKLPVVQILMEGKVIRVPSDTLVFKLGRFAKQQGYKLHKRTTTEGLILWLDKVEP